MLFLQAFLNLLLFAKHSHSTNNSLFVPEFDEYELIVVHSKKNYYRGWFEKIRATLAIINIPNSFQIEETIEELEGLMPDGYRNFQEYGGSLGFLLTGLYVQGMKSIRKNHPGYETAVRNTEKKLLELCRNVGIEDFEEHK